jgi:hypothetical protein
MLLMMFIASLVSLSFSLETVIDEHTPVAKATLALLLNEAPKDCDGHVAVVNPRVRAADRNINSSDAVADDNVFEEDAMAAYRPQQ